MPPEVQVTPTPSPTPAPTPTPTPTPTPAPTGIAGAPSWFPDATPEDIAHINNRGWDKADNAAKSVYQSYRGLEKLVGAIKTDQALIIPGEGADQKTIDTFYNKLGRPETADKYGVKDFANMSPEMNKSLKELAHKEGFSDKQMKSLEKWNNDSGAAVIKTLEDNAKVQLATQQTALKATWGAAHDQNMQIAKEAANKLGWTKEQIDAMQVGLGYDGVMKLAHQLGVQVGEGKIVTAEGGARASGNSQVMAPAEAKLALKALETDKTFKEAWMNKNHPDHAAAVAKKSQYSAWANATG